MSISVIIIAKNEAHNLTRTLPRLSWCDDIVLIDDNSTDNTIAVAKSFGCKVYTRTFDGFGSQKQYAASKAQHHWILNIDADEVLTDELISEITTLNLDTTSYVGYEIPVRHVFLDRIFTYGKESRFYHLRLFNLQYGNFNSALVHEKVELKGAISKLENVVLHYSYRDLNHYFEKLNRYSTIGADKLFQQGKSRNLLLTLAAFPIYFFKHYFIYGNLLNGREGFIWSYLNAWYHVVKYLKLGELNRKK